MREAVLSVSDEDLAAAGIGELVAHCRAAGLRDVTELDCRGDGAVVLATVAEPLEPDLLDALEYVESWELVGRGCDDAERGSTAADQSSAATRRTDGAQPDPAADGGATVDASTTGSADDGFQYRIAFTAPEIPAAAGDAADELVGECDPELRPDGADVSLTGPQSAIGDAVAAYEDAGLSPDLRELGSYDGPDDPLDALTARQREVVLTAWERGYFEVPREASTEDVGAALDLDGSTVTEHLQRAQRNLVGELLDGERS